MVMDVKTLSHPIEHNLGRRCLRHAESFSFNSLGFTWKLFAPKGSLIWIFNNGVMLFSCCAAWRATYSAYSVTPFLWEDYSEFLDQTELNWDHHHSVSEIRNMKSVKWCGCKLLLMISCTQRSQNDGKMALEGSVSGLMMEKWEQTAI